MLLSLIVLGMDADSNFLPTTDLPLDSITDLTITTTADLTFAPTVYSTLVSRIDSTFASTDGSSVAPTTLKQTTDRTIISLDFSTSPTLTVIKNIFSIEFRY